MKERPTFDSWYSEPDVECVAVALEEGEVRVHAGAGVLGEGLGHERRLDALLQPATSSTTRRNVMMLSAVESASA